MNCINFRKRAKDYKTYFYCAKLRKEIELNSCSKCEYREYKIFKPMKQNKPIKQRTYKQAKAEANRSSILTENLSKCLECGRANCNIQIHEIFFGRNRQNSIKYGLVIPLCGVSCHNQYDCIGIHFNKEMCLKWQIKGQLECMKHYGMSEEEFAEIFKKSYLQQKKS